MSKTQNCEESTDKKKCPKCDPLAYENDELVNRDGFTIYVDDNYLVYDYSEEYAGNAGKTRINYCPECGKKLKVYKYKSEN